MKMTKKIEYYLFIILIFFQNFAVITTKEFGLNGLVVFLIFISLFRFKKYYSKVNIKFLEFLFIVIIFLICGLIINDVFYFTQIMKNIITVWLFYAIYMYMKQVYEEKNEQYFWKCFGNVALIMFSYGIYELIANIYNLPLFMNIFNNNVSYKVREIDDYVAGGWIERVRLYNLFFEPSLFAFFLVYVLFLIKELKYINKKKKFLLYILIFFNFYFTYSRTGYVILLYMYGIYWIYKIFKQNAKILDNIFLLFPFVNLFIMYKIGLNLFTDLSSLLRTYSGMYYLKNTFSSFKSILFGHGCGSVINNIPRERYVQSCAHNGYSDLLYQYGLIFFIYLGYLIKKLLKNIKNQRYLIVGAVSTLCCFGVYYGIETIIALIVVIYVFCKEESEENEKRIYEV